MEFLLHIILPIVLALLAGCNIIQLVNNRQLRSKLAAEAKQEENNALSQIINGQTKEIARLQTNYGELQEKYFALAEELQNVKAEMAQLKAKKRPAKKVQ